MFPFPKMRTIQLLQKSLNSHSKKKKKKRLQVRGASGKRDSEMTEKLKRNLTLLGDVSEWDLDEPGDFIMVTNQLLPWQQ